MEQPRSFAADEDWGRWVLTHGMPPLPRSVTVGEAVPVGCFSGPTYGAVAFVSRWFDDIEEREQVDFDVQPFVRIRGEWVATEGAGGTDWLISDEPLLRRHDWVRADEVAFAHAHASGIGDTSCAALIGLAGADAATIRVMTPDGEVTRSVDSPLGVIVAAADATVPAEVAVIAADGTVLATERLDELSSPPLPT